VGLDEGASHGEREYTVHEAPVNGGHATPSPTSGPLNSCRTRDWVYSLVMTRLSTLSVAVRGVMVSALAVACAGPGRPAPSGTDSALHETARRIVQREAWARRMHWAQGALHGAPRDAGALRRAADQLRDARAASLRGEDIPMGLAEVRATASLIAQLEAARRRAVGGHGSGRSKGLSTRATTFRWPVARAIVSSEFGVRADPFHPRHRTFHNGIDLVVRSGDPVFSPAPGAVASVGWRGDGCGLGVVLVHGNGYETEYCHLGAVAVEPGTILRKGSVVGTVGATGRTTGVHLHWTVRAGGRAVNPRWIIGRSVDG
jgi:murein DD-endopeptidase MepM/ murein hydrolase activator NlpD